MSPSLYDSSLAFVAIQAALKAGNLLRKGFGTQFSISSKANAQDLVTEYDKAAEDVIINFIREQFTGHSFLAEESGASESNHAPVCWIIDPLDGTMNFTHHIPLFAVSIAAYIDERVELGVIYHPMAEELFVAQRGRGAYLNGTRLHVSAVSEMQSAVSATGFPYGLTTLRQKSTEQFINFVDIGNPIRIIGSAALTLAYVAAGRFDAYWGTFLKPWDMAAGKLLVEEAGGKTTHFDASPLDIFQQPNIVATNALLHDAVLAFLS